MIQKEMEGKIMLILTTGILNFAFLLEKLFLLHWKTGMHS